MGGKRFGGRGWVRALRLVSICEKQAYGGGAVGHAELAH